MTLSEWKAIKADETYSPGQKLIIYSEAKDRPRFLGDGIIPNKEQLINLIEETAQDLIKNCHCDRVYLASMCENNELHFWVIPIYQEQKEKYKSSGFVLMAKLRDDWYKHYIDIVVHKEKLNEQAQKDIITKSHTD